MKKMFTLVALAISTSLTPFVSSAFGDERVCDGANTTVQINECAGKLFDEADAQLNHVYQRVMGGLRASHDSADIIESLVSAQLLWIKLRDADCEAVRKTWGGGTGGTSAYLFCLRAKTQERSKFLLDNFSGDTN